MSSSNVNVMVKEAVRALKANNKAEARALLEKATELDPYNEQAWLWLSGVVDLEDDQRTCLQNVLFINPGNENAKQGLAMLDAKIAARPAPEPEPLNEETFADFDLPSGDDWLAELDSMRNTATTMPTTNPFNVPLDDFSDTGGDVFADPFGDPFGAAGGPFGVSSDVLPTIPPPPVTATVVAKPSDLTDDLDALFGGDQPASPLSDEPPPAKSGRREKAAPEKKADPLANIPDDADAATLFGIIPPEIRIGSLPGADKKPSTLLRLVFIGLILANIAVAVLLFDKVTLP